jgi:hypothetical protein
VPSGILLHAPNLGHVNTKRSPPQRLRGLARGRDDAVAAIDENRDLSPEGRARRRAELGSGALQELTTSKSGHGRREDAET